MQMRQSTMGGTPSYSNTPYASGSPYDSPHATPPPPSHADPLAAYRASAQAAYAAGGNARQDAALREHSFIGTAEAQLDALIAQGRATWGNLGEQREILKGTQRRLRDAGVTMGLSRNVIVSACRGALLEREKS
jgi:Golgi SNAP receptor complex protein 2